MSFSELTAARIGLGSATVGDLFSAIAVLLAGLIVTHIVTKMTARALSRGTLNPRIQKYIVRGLKCLLYLITVLIILECLDVHAASLVALLSVGSLGLTLAAEDILGNVAGGIVILSSHPFALGDYLSVDGAEGTVEEISLNHTTLLTQDGLTVLIPNKTLASSKLTNYTALGRRRVVQKVTASYDAPTDAVKAACGKAVERTPDVLADPAPAVHLTSYGASSIEYTVACWCRPEHYWPVYFTVGENLRDAFAEARIEMTYDHLNVHVVEDRTK
jgi:small conductance mechanosensitive channel